MFFILLLLITFSFCIDVSRREEIFQRRKKEFKYISECLLKNERTSPELKQSIKETPEERVNKVIYNPKLEKTDMELIRNCRREAHRVTIEEIKREEKLKAEEHSKDL